MIAFTQLLEGALRALLLASVIGAGLWLLRVRNVFAQKAVWALVLAASLLMPLAMRWGLPGRAAITVPMPAWAESAWARVDGGRIDGEREEASTRTETEIAQPAVFRASRQLSPEPVRSSNLHAAAARTDFQRAGNANAVNETTTPVITASGATEKILIRPALIGGLLYLCVCAVLLLRLFYGAALAWRLWRRAVPIASESALVPALQVPVLHLDAELNALLAGGLEIRSSREVFSPVTIGSGVVLPENYAAWDEEKMRIVLAHERSHVRQGDFYLQLAAGIHAALFWFSPLGWWLKHKLTELGEAISDHAGLTEAASRASYAQLLLEFAALPRPTLTGVAMSRRNNLSNRIERLLNESIFSQAFTRTRRPALLAVLLVPAALFVATALVRVEAAGRPQTTLAATPAQAAAPATPAVDAVPAPPSPEAPAAPQIPEAPPAPQAALAPLPPPPPLPEMDSDDESYAVVTDPNSSHIRFNGEYNDESNAEIKKAAGLAHGKFLWFTHDGKPYIVDDPEVMARIDELYKPIDALGEQEEALGKQQEALDAQQEKIDVKVDVKVDPELDVKISKLTQQIDVLVAQKADKINAEAQAKVQSKIAEIQKHIDELTSKISEKANKMAEEASRQGEMAGKLGEQEGKLGAMEGKLGEQEGKLAEEADRKIRSIIDESLQNGKARPVQ
jgi:beta-lactamase regulating signal transducer with metallopeptidase domain